MEEEEELDVDRREIVDDIFENIADIYFKPLISVTEVCAHVRSLLNELIHLKADNSMDSLKKIFAEEEIKYEIDISERDSKYLQVRLFYC